MTTEALKLYTFPLIIQVNVCAVSPYMVAMFSGQKNVIKPFRNRKFSETFVISGDGATSWVRQTGREEERGKRKNEIGCGFGGAVTSLLEAVGTSATQS